MQIEFFSSDFLKNTQISNFTKIGPVGAELFHADGQTYRRDEDNSRLFANFTKEHKNWKSGFFQNGSNFLPDYSTTFRKNNIGLWDIVFEFHNARLWRNVVKLPTVCDGL